ncbi:MAG: threonine aldolase family protein [Bacteroidota bacterium]
MKRSFASDNNAGVHPVVMDAIVDANKEDFVSYGDDPHTEKMKAYFDKQFGKKVDTFLVCTGTGANVSSISHLIRPWQTILCAETAHLNHDECAAPEKYMGSKLATVPSDNGKVTPEQFEGFLYSVGFEHHAQPGIISITQATEMGCVYTPEEINKIRQFATKNNLLLHVDGARIANSLVKSGVSLKEMITDTGVDVISFGGTKNGLMMGEAVVFLRPGLSDGFQYVRKQSMQLSSKMRFMAAQFVAWFEEDLWLKLAAHANKMADLLAQKVESIPEIHLTAPVETNAVFATIPKQIIEPLQQKYFFYIWNEMKNEVRWMTHFNTSEEDLDAFVKEIKKLLQQK